MPYAASLADTDAFLAGRSMMGFDISQTNFHYLRHE